ncbi:MAG: hypothetical protein M3436_07685 [Pseudomonadota bacterium]|nr:hypothetical protein [Pseudomonadota bacterium]
MKYGRADEIEADKLGLCLMNQAGYRPATLLDVMRILAEAGGRSPLPEFASTTSIREIARKRSKPTSRI